MNAIVERLREELKDTEYSEGYAESFLDSYIATQIKVLREQSGLSQQGLADILGSRQGVVSRIENANYSKWSISTLKKLARAFRVRLKVSFETYGSLLADVSEFSRQSLERAPREKDPLLNAPAKFVVRLSRRNRNHKRDGKRSNRSSNLLQMTRLQQEDKKFGVSLNGQNGLLPSSQFTGQKNNGDRAESLPA